MLVVRDAYCVEREIASLTLFPRNDSREYAMRYNIRIKKEVKMAYEEGKELIFPSPYPGSGLAGEL